MDQDCFDAGIDDHIHMLRFQDGLPFNDYLRALNGNHFTSVFINKVFYPGAYDAGSQFGPDGFFQRGFADFDLMCQVENLKNIFIRFESDGTQQCRYG